MSLNKKENKIAQQFIFRKLKRCSEDGMRKEVEILLRLSTEIEKQYNLNELLTQNYTFKDFSAICRRLLDEKNLNWGRITVVYTFAAKLAEKYVEENNEKMVSTLINFLSIIITEKSSWILNHGGGWNGFITRFEKQSYKKLNVYILISPLFLYFIMKFCTFCFL